MFLDEKLLHLKAGKGGDGAILFRREIYVPKGGPSGGDGGRGGDVVLVGRNNLHTLSHLAYTDKIAAEDGANGGSNRSTGRSGEHTELLLPLGTVVYIKHLEGWTELVELTEEDQRLVIVKGGNGGWGNWHFRSSIQQAPERANDGLAGGEVEVKLVLKLIADVGLVGLPNAGKSTLLSVISSARPKIADYPFTTLEPQLGVAKVHGEQTLVFADLPGLIEGASGGKGLGSRFLKHIERTHKILHCLDSSQPLEEMLQNYQIVRTELEQWSPELAQKEERLLLTKTDLILAEELAEKSKVLSKKLGRPVLAVSAASHHGIEEMLTACL